MTALAVFEMASDSLRKDRLAKAALYARTGIPEYVTVPAYGFVVADPLA